MSNIGSRGHHWKLSPETIARQSAAKMGHPSTGGGRKKGFIPWNKGMKGVYGSSKKGRTGYKIKPWTIEHRINAGKNRPLGDFTRENQFVLRKYGRGEIYIVYDITKPPMCKYRYIMEQHLGRKLIKSECVHHINFDHFDNRIENLQVMNVKAHYAMHRRLRRRCCNKT